MAGDIVNLRRARKARDRAVAGETAARNRALFGRTGMERATTTEAIMRRDAALDAHRVERPPGAAQRPDE